MLTQKRLKELLDYDPNTGVFTWLVDKGPVKKGYAIRPKTNRYIAINIDGQQYGAHRLVWLWLYGHWPEDEIDHINHKKYDNRRDNLRSVSHKVNTRNRKRNKDNTSGYTGVCWHKTKKKWIGMIKVDGKTIYLGSFMRIQDAIKSRRKAEIEYGFYTHHNI